MGIRSPPRREVATIFPRCILLKRGERLAQWVEPSEATSGDMGKQARTDIQKADMGRGAVREVVEIK